MEEIIENGIDLGRIEFGPYKGYAWATLPLAYLYYLCSDECRAREEIKATARAAINMIRHNPDQLNLFEEK